MKLNIHKIQCVLKPGMKADEIPRAWSMIKVEYQGTACVTLTVRGKQGRDGGGHGSSIEPLFYELIIPLSLEEIFISETEVAGYDIKKLIF